MQIYACSVYVAVRDWISRGNCFKIYDCHRIRASLSPFPLCSWRSQSLVWLPNQPEGTERSLTSPQTPGTRPPQPCCFQRRGCPVLEGLSDFTDCECTGHTLLLSMVGLQAVPKLVLEISREDGSYQWALGRSLRVSPCRKPISCLGSNLPFAK